MEEFTTLATAIALAILLAVTSMRSGRPLATTGSDVFGGTQCITGLKLHATWTNTVWKSNAALPPGYGWPSPSIRTPRRAAFPSHCTSSSA